jgi:hypothetical protein
MSTQKAKFELFSRLEKMGFTYEEAAQLRRIEMTLHRWSEQECGDGNDFASWSIERDEKTNKPFRCVYPHNGPSRRYPIADREGGALKRAQAIIKARNGRLALGEDCDEFITVYQQGDCRGCSLYLMRTADVPCGGNVESYYTRGFAVCA